MSTGTLEALINPELTAEPGHPRGGIRESREYQHTYPQIRLNTFMGGGATKLETKGQRLARRRKNKKNLKLLVMFWS